MTNHTTALDLDDIETRAARLYEYSQQGDGEGDTLAGEDVPALLAEVRRLRAELAAVHALCDEQEMAGRLFELPEPEWVRAVRAAAAPAAPAAAASAVSGAADSRQP